MVEQPTKEAYELLLKRVKALEEELKRVRNEKKETSRSPAEVELEDRKTRDKKVDAANQCSVWHWSR